MEDRIFDISFQLDGVDYSGWVNPDDENMGPSNWPAFHVVLNGASFGNLYYKDCRWEVNEERPVQITEAVGREIEKHFQL